jgi:hypothetical protein
MAFAQRPGGPGTTTDTGLARLLNPARKYRATFAFLLIFIFVAAAGAVTFYGGPPSGKFDTAPLTVPKSAKAASRCKAAHGSAAKPLTISPASGAGAILNIYIGQNGDREVGRTAPLLVQKGKLCPGSILPMEPGEFTRGGGATLPGNQIVSWARVNNDGTHATVWVLVAPHYRHSSDAGLYSGAVALDSAAVQGANVPVHVHIEYQNRNFVLAFGFIAAFFGFIWAWLLHNIDGGRPTNQGYFFRHLALCLAVLLAATIPIVNVQVLAKPDWEGTLTQYISLATLVGAAAIAATPTLRALVVPQSLGRDKKVP